MLHEPVVIFRIPAVSVNHGSRDIAGGRHAHVGHTHLAGEGIFVHGIAILFQGGFILVGLEHHHTGLPWLRKIDVVLDESDIFESILDETVSNIFSKLTISLGARSVRLLGQIAEVTPRDGGVESYEELVLDLELTLTAGLREPRQLTFLARGFNRVSRVGKCSRR